MKILPVGAELLQAEGQTDGHDAVNSLFSQFFEFVYRCFCCWLQNFPLPISRKFKGDTTEIPRRWKPMCCLVRDIARW